jgi:hypothetical protein
MKRNFFGSAQRFSGPAAIASFSAGLALHQERRAATRQNKAALTRPLGVGRSAPSTPDGGNRCARQRIRIDGLGQMFIESRFDRPAFILGLSPTRYCTQGGVRAEFARPNLTRDLVSIHLRHANVEKHDIRTVATKFREPLGTVIGDPGLKAFGC